MDETAIATQLQTLLLLLVCVAAFAGLARKWRIPYPIVLVVAGLALSFIPHIPHIPLTPDVVFFLFLPPLLYAAAFLTSWRDFRQHLVSIAMLAFGLVAFTVWGVAYTAEHFITALDWKSGFLLGAVVSTTDSIAATSIAKSLRLPQRIVDLLEGESLLNDATGLLALEFGLLLLLRGQSPSPTEGFLRLAWLAGGGVAIGLLIGIVTAWFERFVDDGPIEIVVSLVVPYAAYLAGEEAHASGVLAVVACGLYMGRKSPTIFSPTVRLQMMSVWRAMTFAMNGLVFVLIGLQLPYVLAGIQGYDRWTLLLYAAIFSLLLIALRLLWMFPASRIAWAFNKFILRRHQPMPKANGVFLVGWTGMRGVVALAAAFSLPTTLPNGEPFAQRNLIIFLTFCVILVTLVLQGATLPPLIRALGLAGKDDDLAGEEQQARLLAVQEGLDLLRNNREEAPESDIPTYDNLIHRYEQRLAIAQAACDPPLRAEATRLHEIEHAATLAERNTLIRLRDQGHIGDEVLRTIERELDLRESRHHPAT